MKKQTDPFEQEKRHPTVVDSSTDEESASVLQVRAGDVWSDFIRVQPENRDPESPPRQDGSVPLLDDMTGIRQWE